MRSATEVFSEWAEQGKDVGMEKGHAAAVGEILAAGIAELTSADFRAIDAGCGNGWVVRMLSSMEGCKSATGVDGASAMINRAKEIDSEIYIHADLLSWKPEVPVEFVHSMEVLYYLGDIPQFLRSVKEYWLKTGGILAFGVDHYYENQSCHNWSEKVGTPMAMYRESEWCEMVEAAGFTILQMFRAAPGPDWPGTLAIIARNN